jgi:hypothetical protein
MLVKQKCDITGKRSWHGKRKYVDRQVEEKTDPGIKKKKSKKGQVKTKSAQRRQGKKRNFSSLPGPTANMHCDGKEKGGGNSHITCH